MQITSTKTEYIAGNNQLQFQVCKSIDMNQVPMEVGEWYLQQLVHMFATEQNGIGTTTINIFDCPKVFINQAGSPAAAPVVAAPILKL